MLLSLTNVTPFFQVEFDVFLTADRTPMIFHDLEINHSNSSKKIPITSLCEEGLCSLDEDNQERIFTGRERVESSVSGGGSGSSNGSFCSGSSTPTSSSGKGGLLEAGKRVSLASLCLSVATYTFLFYS